MGLKLLEVFLSDYLLSVVIRMIHDVVGEFLLVLHLDTPLLFRVAHHRVFRGDFLLLLQFLQIIFGHYSVLRCDCVF